MTRLRRSRSESGIFTGSMADVSFPLLIPTLTEIERYWPPEVLDCSG